MLSLSSSILSPRFYHLPNNSSILEEFCNLKTIYSCFFGEKIFSTGVFRTFDIFRAVSKLGLTSPFSICEYACCEIPIFFAI